MLSNTNLPATPTSLVIVAGGDDCDGDCLELVENALASIVKILREHDTGEWSDPLTRSRSRAVLRSARGAA